MKKHTVLVLALGMIATSASAQDPVPTGMVRSGSISLSRLNISLSAGPLGSFQSTTDSFRASFTLTDYSKFNVSGNQPTSTTIGLCTVVSFTQLPTVTDNSGGITILDAGPAINLTGPNGSKTFPAQQFIFAGQLGGGTALPFPGAPAAAPLYLDAGTYTVDNGGGGADVGPFTATITIPATFTWKNADDASVQSIDRSVGVDIAWTGGDPNSTVLINGGVFTTDPVSHQIGGTIYSCKENNSAGHFFVSPDILSLLPASTAGVGSNGTLSVSGGVQGTFSATGIDLGIIIFSTATNRTPAYQ